MALLSRLEAGSNYLTGLLPPMICIGVCLGLLTPGGRRSGDEFGTRLTFRTRLRANNTARQAFGAIGVALFGARRFPGLHRLFLDRTTCRRAGGRWAVVGRHRAHLNPRRTRRSQLIEAELSGDSISKKPREPSRCLYGRFESDSTAVLG